MLFLSPIASAALKVLEHKSSELLVPIHRFALMLTPHLAGSAPQILGSQFNYWLDLLVTDVMSKVLLVDGSYEVSV